MGSLATYITGGLALVLALDFAAPSIATTVVGSMYPQPASFAARFTPATSPQAISSQVIDRTGKGSRLPMASSASSIVKNTDVTGRSAATSPKKNPVREVETEDSQQAKPARTPVGCEPAYSPLSRAVPRQFIGRCST